VIIDGGNSYYKDDVRRSQKLKERSIHCIDVGPAAASGAERGYCMMLGGPKEAVGALILFSSRTPGMGGFHTPRPGEAGGQPSRVIFTAVHRAPGTS
jgi:6-phosphogluconate dehydrogenase